MSPSRPFALAIAAVILLTIGVRTLQAQVSIGAVVGVNRGHIRGDLLSDTLRYGSRLGLVAGVVVEIPIAKAVRLVFQPGYIQRGTDLLFWEGGGGGEFVKNGSIELDYVTMPILLKILANNGWLYVTSGVDVGYLTSATKTEKGTVTDVKDSVKEYDVAVVFGVGGLIPIGRPKLSIEARYNAGLVSLGEGVSLDPTGLPGRFRNAGLQLLAGILVPLGGER